MLGELATMQPTAMQATRLHEAGNPQAEQSSLATYTCTGSSYPAMVNPHGQYAWPARARQAACLRHSALWFQFLV
ncbi:hypothetical protein M1D93_20905 (plasmid) [Arthrobacter sp. Z1-9]